jgi:dTDP-4-amino-4,6-dideoxygalactose transaminase
MRRYANHGALKKHEHQVEGINSRLDGLQAAILSAKLPHIHAWTEARRRVAGWYDAAFAGVRGVETPGVRPGASHVYHLYVIKVPGRDELMKKLQADGIDVAVHYPVALPAMEAYAYLGMRPEQTPRAIANSARILSLPIYPELQQSAVERVVAAVARHLGA